MNDLKFALRQVLKYPGFTAVAVLTLAIGIGATTSISCWLNALVLKPLPFPDADQLVLMSESWVEKGWGRSDVSAGTFIDWQQQASSFNSMAAFEETTLRMGAGRGEQSLRGLNVSIAFFEVLKTFPVLGRPFGAEEDQLGKDRVVILSHDLWQNRFNGRPDVIGAPLELDGTPFTIIGVMPAGFRFPYHTEVWTPMSFGAEELDQRGHRLLKVVGHLKANFRTLRVPLMRGRLFPENWKKGEPIEVVENETLAHRFWPGQNPIGKRFKPDSPGAMWTTVAGLVRDFQLDRDQEASPRFYTSYLSGAYLEGAQLLLRADGPMTKAVASARQSLKGFDPYQTNPNVRTVNAVLGDALRSRFQILGLLIGFACAALLLAAIGIYGVVSYLVAQRTHEVGIRIALGALPADVVSLVIRQGMAPVLVGIGCGILGALGLGHLLASRLFGVESTNPAVFAVSSITMLLTAALACLFPARRAAKIDPIEALRYE